jgi:hypothetical protein
LGSKYEYAVDTVFTFHKELKGIEDIMYWNLMSELMMKEYLMFFKNDDGRWRTSNFTSPYHLDFQVGYFTH